MTREGCCQHPRLELPYAHGFIFQGANELPLPPRAGPQAMMSRAGAPSHCLGVQIPTSPTGSLCKPHSSSFKTAVGLWRLHCERGHWHPFLTQVRLGSGAAGLLAAFSRMRFWPVWPGLVAWQLSSIAPADSGKSWASGVHSSGCGLSCRGSIWRIPALRGRHCRLRPQLLPQPPLLAVQLHSKASAIMMLEFSKRHPMMMMISTYWYGY